MRRQFVTPHAEPKKKLMGLFYDLLPVKFVRWCDACNEPYDSAESKENTECENCRARLRARRSYGQETKRLAGFALIGQEMTASVNCCANFSLKTPPNPRESFKLRGVAYRLRA